jgi:photosynthetic reaction center cytochrome c subunit
VKRSVVNIGSTAALLLFIGPRAEGQAAADPKPLMAEQFFKNVQVLKGISVNEFMETMGFFAAALGYNCTSCHVEQSLQDWAKFADDVPAKRRARDMITMANNFNKIGFGGRRALTCYTCHRGSGVPKVTPSLAEQYGTPIDDPNEVEVFAVNPNALSVDQILDRYIQSSGGAQKLSGLTSIYGKGTYDGFDTDAVKVPAELFARAPGQRSVVAHLRLGDSIATYDGRAGWIAGPDKPVPVLAVPAGPDLDTLRLDAALAFPGGIKQVLSQWKTGFPNTAINDRDVDVLEGKTAGGTRVKLFFDKDTGLLARVVRFADTVVGIVPVQTDFLDYRDVSGFKIPFKRIETWTDGQSNVELSEVQVNIQIDAAKFGRPPAPAAPPKPAAR